MFSIKRDTESLRRQLESEIAQAEVVIASNNAKHKGYEPTIAYFQGQMNTCQKILAQLDQSPPGLWLSPISLAMIAVGGIFVWLLH